MQVAILDPEHGLVAARAVVLIEDERVVHGERGQLVGQRVIEALRVDDLVHGAEALEVQHARVEHAADLERLVRLRVPVELFAVPHVVDLLTERLVVRVVAVARLGRRRLLDVGGALLARRGVVGGLFAHGRLRVRRRLDLLLQVRVRVVGRRGVLSGAAADARAEHVDEQSAGNSRQRAHEARRGRDRHE